MRTKTTLAADERKASILSPKALLGPVVRLSKHRASKPGHHHMERSQGTVSGNAARALTSVRRSTGKKRAGQRGALGAVPQHKRPAVYKIDARRAREAAADRQAS
jgi:hypothetical protein